MSNLIACVVLAAGLSKRFGSSKQLAKIGKSGKSLIQNSVDIANGSKSEYVLLVLGHDASEIMNELSLGRAQLILNKDYESGLSSSLRAALSNLPGECKAAVFMVADQPNLTSSIVDRLIDAFSTQSKTRAAKIVALSFQGEPRNPVLISSDLFTELSQLTGDVGAREILRNHRNESKLVEVGDPRIFLDLDTPSSLI